MEAAAPVQTRKAYKKSDYNYIAANYREREAKDMAAALGRTVGSLKDFIRKNPELQKRPRA